MLFWQYITLTVIAAILTIITTIITTVWRFYYKNPMIHGILKIYRFERDSKIDYESLAEVIKSSLVEKDNSFIIKKGEFNKRVRIEKTEVIKIMLGKIEGEDQMITGLTVIETNENSIYAYLLGPNAKLSKRINGYDLCMSKITPQKMRKASVVRKKTT